MPQREYLDQAPDGPLFTDYDLRHLKLSVLWTLEADTTLLHIDPSPDVDLPGRRILAELLSAPNVVGDDGLHIAYGASGQRIHPVVARALA